MALLLLCCCSLLPPTANSAISICSLAPPLPPCPALPSPSGGAGVPPLPPNSLSLCLSFSLYMICMHAYPPRLSQVDGPTHFVKLAGGGRRPNGATRLKRRLLGRVGWRVVSVPYWEWAACAGPAEQAAYLRELLRGPAEPR